MVVLLVSLGLYWPPSSPAGPPVGCALLDRGLCPQPHSVPVPPLQIEKLAFHVLDSEAQATLSPRQMICSFDTGRCGEKAMSRPTSTPATCHRHLVGPSFPWARSCSLTDPVELTPR